MDDTIYQYGYEKVFFFVMINKATLSLPRLPISCALLAATLGRQMAALKVSLDF
jgi:hypothetical protein